MALPKLDKLGTDEATSKAQEVEVKKLYESIKNSYSDGMKATNQATISELPKMIKELTDEVKSGSIDNFSTAINKLVKLTDTLGINLRDYNEDLADTVDRFTKKQASLEDQLADYREKGFQAEIRNNAVVLLTQREVFALQKEYKVNEKEITSKTLERVQLQKALDEADVKGADKRVIAQKDIEQNEKDISKLKEDNEKIEKKTGMTADTGRNEDQGFGKFQELKEAFMIIPDTIGDAMTSFSKAGKGVFTGLTSLFTKGGLAKAFKGLVNFFKTARIMIAAVFLLVVAAIQFVAERIDKIADFFVKIWNKITGFFKAIGEWFSNSWLGKKLGLGKDDDGETDKRTEKLKAKSYDNMDDGTYAVGNDGADIKDNNVDEFLSQSKDASAAPAVGHDGKIYQPGEEGYENAKSNRSQDTQSYLEDSNSVNEKLSIKDLTGNQVGDGETSSLLKELNGESDKVSSNNVVNIQNNSSVNSSQSSASNVSGFIDHEPDTSFKYVRRSNGDEYI